MMHRLALLVENREEAPHHHRLRLRQHEVAAAARAGQFVHVLPQGAASSTTASSGAAPAFAAPAFAAPAFAAPASFDPLLRRAFSIMDAGLGESGEEFEILFRVQGRGTEQLARLGAGALLDVLGPLGRAFAPPSQQALLVGGGVGVPPLVMLAAQSRRAKEPEEQIVQRETGARPTVATDTFAPSSLMALVGARTQADLIGLRDFAAHDVPVEVATEDGSAGVQGRVTTLLQRRLEEFRQEFHGQGAMGEVGGALTVYACGPTPMLRAVASLCARHAVPCQVSLEENMPCGVGVCNGCVVPVVGAADDYGRYRRVCVDGPVVWAHEIAWSEFSAAP